MSVNIALLREVVEWAEDEDAKPEAECQWYQARFHIDGRKIDRDCGTAYCIAGYIQHKLIGKVNDAADPIAREALGIDIDDAWSLEDGLGLFCAENTIKDIRRIAEMIAENAGERL